MATLPTIPSFDEDDSSLDKLQQLAYAVQFLSNDDVRPTWHLYRNATTAYSASAWTTQTMGTEAFDSDNMFDSPGVEIQTAGYYAMTACLQVEATSTGHAFVGAFLITGGSNNPNLGSGDTFNHGYRGSVTSNTTPADNAICLSDITPFAVYPGDTIIVQVYTTASMTGDYNQNTSYIQGRFVTNFTGRWMRAAS